MSKLHIADAETSFRAYNVTPDFCEVQGQVVPFDIVRTLDHEKRNYAQTVRARGVPVLIVGSVVQGVDGDSGKGVATGTSAGSGDTVTISGSGTVRVEGTPVSRHDDQVTMNGVG